MLLAKSRIGEMLMITHPTVQALNLLWHQLYGDLVIVDLSKLLLSQRPLDADVVQDFVKDSCAQIKDVSRARQDYALDGFIPVDWGSTRSVEYCPFPRPIIEDPIIILFLQQLLVNDWLPRCADLMDLMRNSWKDMVPMTGKYGGRAETLLKCVHALMSRHLESLINKSLAYLFKVLCSYKHGNEIDEYSMFDKKLQRRPLLALTVSVVGAHFDNEPIDFGPGVRADENIYVFDADDADPFQQPGQTNPVLEIVSEKLIIKDGLIYKFIFGLGTRYR